MPARTLAVGDIHGCQVALDVLLTQLAPTAHDTLIILGDVIDRGPGTREAIDRLIDVSQTCNLAIVLGNHEEMMLDSLEVTPQGTTRIRGGWYEDWVRFGGSETLASYGGDARSVPPAHLEFLGRGRDLVESNSHLFIHANLEPGVPLDQQPPEWLRWTHLTGFEQPHPSGKKVICGHTPQRSGRPLASPGWVCIDTLAFGGGWLTALDVDTGEIFQANQAGKFRSGWV